jgi:hypothetical protein
VAIARARITKTAPAEGIHRDDINLMFIPNSSVKSLVFRPLKNQKR